MNGAIITVENLGKQYRIRHQTERQRYVALRDVIAARFGGRLFSGRSQPSTLNPQPSTSFGGLLGAARCLLRGPARRDRRHHQAPRGGQKHRLKTLSRITEPKEGRAGIKGRVAGLLELGTGFHPELTRCQKCFLNGAILGIMRAKIGKNFCEIPASVRRHGTARF